MSKGTVRGGKHTPAGNGGSWLWPVTREAIYCRDGHACVYCGSMGQLQVDHYVRVQDGGTNSPNNLVTCCRSCNSSKQNLTIRAWYARLRKKGYDTDYVGQRARRLMKKNMKRYREQAKVIIAARRLQRRHQSPGLLSRCTPCSSDPEGASSAAPT